MSMGESESGFSGSRDRNDFKGTIWMLALYVATVLVIVLHQRLVGVDNNFTVYRAAFRHLAAGQNLYADYPSEHGDVFKYSPTFALLFAPFSQAPVFIGLLLWNSLNALLLFYAVRRLLPGRDGTIALALIYLEVVRTTQRAQANALVAALIIIAYLAFERRREVAGDVAIALGVFVKIFPVAALALAVFHERRWRMALAFVAGIVVGAGLPLLVTSPSRLLAQYGSWFALEGRDAVASAQGTTGAGLYGGVMFQLRFWLGVQWPNWPIQLVGVILQLAPLARRGVLERSRFPAALSLLSPGVRGDLQPPGRIAVIRHRRDGNCSVVRERGAAAARRRADGAYPARRLRLLHRTRPPLAARRLREIPPQDHSVRARMARNAGGAAGAAPPLASRGGR